MIKVKALVNFAGAFSMYKGETREIEKNDVAIDLINCKYVEEVKAKPKKVVLKNEN